MTLDKILSIGGKPGLYKLIVQTRGGFVVESLLDQKRTTVGMRSNVSVLSEIAVYTLEEELPLRKVFQKIKDKEDGGKTAIGHKEEKIKLEEYFFEVLPDYDEDRVYASDIKKIIQWYNILHDNGVTDFSDPKDEKDAKAGTTADGGTDAKDGDAAESSKVKGDAKDVDQKTDTGKKAIKKSAVKKPGTSKSQGKKSTPQTASNKGSSAKKGAQKNPAARKK